MGAYPVVPFEPTCHGAEPILAARGQHEVEAFGRKHLGKRLANAGGSAGNERYSTLRRMKHLR
jgi:hypothetical protein